VKQLSLLVCFIVTISAVSHAESSIPEYLGVFGNNNGVLTELDYIELDDGNQNFEWKSVHLEPSDSLTILVYGDYSPSSLELSKVTSTLKTRKVEREVIRTRIKPLSGVQGLIGSLLIIEPRTPFEVGHYILASSSTNENWSFTVGDAGSLFSPGPVYSVAEYGDLLLAGTDDGMMIYGRGNPYFISFLDNKEKFNSFRIGKICFAGSGKFSNVDGDPVVIAFPVDRAPYMYLFNLNKDEAKPIQLPHISMAFFKMDIAKYYDVIFPQWQTDLPFYCASGCIQSETKSPFEDDGLVLQPKISSMLSFSFGDASVYTAVSAGDAVYCAAEADTGVVMFGTTIELFRSDYDFSKGDYTTFAKIKRSPKNVRSLACTPSGRHYALDATGSVFTSADHGNTWEPNSSFPTASAIIACQTSPHVIAYCNQNSWHIFDTVDTVVEINGVSINSLLFSKTTNRMYAATSIGLYRSDNLGQSWILLP